MSFWRTFGFHTVSAVDSLLDRESFELTDLLDEEEILQEVKSQNKKLIDYLAKPEVLEQLFEYLTVEPEEDAESKRRFKYPFLACEILCSEVWTVTENIFENDKLIKSLFEFLHRDPPLNALLAAYVSKVAGQLLQRKVPEVVTIMKNIDGVTDDFVKHLGNASVMELLLKLISIEDSDAEADVLDWFAEEKLIPKLVGKFDPSLSVDVHENAAQALVDIIHASSVPGAGLGLDGGDDQQAQQQSSPLIKQLESEEVISKLFDFMLADEATSSLLFGLTVLIELVKSCSLNDLNTTAKLEDLSPVLQMLMTKLGQFKAILTKPPVKDEMPTTAGVLTPALGFYRLKVMEFAGCLSRTNFKCVNDRIMEEGLLEPCLDLFFKYTNNNFMHRVIEHMAIAIVQGEDPELRKRFIQQCKLADQLAEASKQNKASMEGDKGMRLGHMGFVTSIASRLFDMGEKVEGVKAVLDESAAWKEYAEGDLKETRDLESQPLGGHKPMALGGDSSDDDDELDLDKANPEMVRVFTQYLAQQAFSQQDFADFNDEDDDDEDDDDDDGQYDDDGEMVFDPSGTSRFEVMDDDDSGTGTGSGTGSGSASGSESDESDGETADGMAKLDISGSGSDDGDVDDMIVHNDDDAADAAAASADGQPLPWQVKKDGEAEDAAAEVKPAEVAAETAKPAADEAEKKDDADAKPAEEEAAPAAATSAAGTADAAGTGDAADAADAADAGAADAADAGAAPAAAEEAKGEEGKKSE